MTPWGSRAADALGILVIMPTLAVDPLPVLDEGSY